MNDSVSFVKKHSFLYIIFTFLMIDFFRYIPSVDMLHDWCTTPYALTYDLGFGSRFLIGSIVHLFIRTLTSEKLYYFILVCNLLLIILSSVMLNLLYIKLRRLKAIAFLIIIYIASPMSISFLFHYVNFGRLDLYLILFSIFQLILLIRFRYSIFTQIMVPVLIFISFATHQVYIFTYFPIILGSVKNLV